MLRIGVVGCGYWGEKHVRVLASMPQVENVVAIDENAVALARMSADYPQVACRSSLGEALDLIDAVVVSTPPASHYPIASTAIRAGKHVFVEKPITVSVAEADALIELAEAHGVALASGHTFVHNAGVHKLVELVESGELGHLRHISAARLNLGLYRDDVNVIWDLAAHDISITLAIMGRTPDEVSAWGMRYNTSDTEDVATVRMRYRAESVDSIIRVSWLDPLKVRTTTLVGSDKMAIYDDMAADERVKVLDRGLENIDDPGRDSMAHLAYRYGDISSPYIDFREPLLVQAEDFVRACMTGERPTADGLAGRDVVAVLEATDRSIMSEGQLVPVAARIVSPELIGPMSR